MSINISLIADDCRDVRMLLRRLLQAEGFLVVEAEDGAQALDMVRTLGTSLKLLISDVQMPKLDGLNLARIARTEFPGMPIILISGDCETFRRGRQQRQFEFLEKPFDLPRLLKLVRTVTTPHKLTPATAGPVSSVGATPSPI